MGSIDSLRRLTSTKYFESLTISICDIKQQIVITQMMFKLSSIVCQER